MQWHKETSSTVVALRFLRQWWIRSACEMLLGLHEMMKYIGCFCRLQLSDKHQIGHLARCLLIQIGEWNVENEILFGDFLCYCYKSLRDPIPVWCITIAACICVCMCMHVHIGILCRIGSRVIQAFILGVFETLSYLEIPELKWFHAALHQIWQWSMKLSHSV